MSGELREREEDETGDGVREGLSERGGRWRGEAGHGENRGAGGGWRRGGILRKVRFSGDGRGARRRSVEGWQ